MRAALGFAACQSKKAQKHIGVKTCKQYAPKGQKHIAQGSALGIMVYIMNNAPCKGKSLI